MARRWTDEHGLHCPGGDGCVLSGLPMTADGREVESHAEFMQEYLEARRRRRACIR